MDDLFDDSSNLTTIEKCQVYNPNRRNKTFFGTNNVDQSDESYDPLRDIINYATSSLNKLYHMDQNSKNNQQQVLGEIITGAINTVSNLIPAVVEQQKSKFSTPEMDLNEYEVHNYYEQIFTINYKDDLNILQLHQKVIGQLQIERGDYLNSMKNELRYHQKTSQTPQTVVERKQTIEKIKKLQSEIFLIEIDNKLNQYIKDSQSILKSYSQIGPKRSVFVFSSNNNQSQEEDEHVKNKRHQIIGEYLELIGKYIDINVLRTISFDYHCQSCRTDLRSLIETDDELLFCPNCNVEAKLPPKSNPVESEDQDNNKPIKDNYDNRPNFVDVTKCFNGTQKNPPSIELYESLNKYFTQQGLIGMIHTSYDDTNIRENGRTSMLDALKYIERPDQYKNINLILHTYWNFPLPNISHLEDVIFEDYDLSQQIYDKSKGDRKSSLNTQFRLYCHLKNRNHPCNASDFKIVASNESLKFHCDICSLKI